MTGDSEGNDHVDADRVGRSADTGAVRAGSGADTPKAEAGASDGGDPDVGGGTVSPAARVGAGGPMGDAVATPEDVADVQVIERRSTPGSLARVLLPELALLGVAVYLFFLAGNFEFQQREGQLGPGFWPQMAAVGLALAVLAHIVQTIRDRNRPIVKVKSEFDEYEEEPAKLHWPSVGLAFALAVGYVFATLFLGYLISTALFLTAFIWAGGQRKWYTPLIGIAGALVFTYVFIGVVFISLPSGVGIFDTISVAVYGLLGIQ